MIQLSCNNITKYYGSELVLKGVSFEVNEGERVALVGPNGCGKSTALKVVGKFTDCEEGTVAIRKDLVIGYLEQNPVYEEGMTALQVLQQAFAEIYECKEQLSRLEERLARGGDDLELVLGKYSECSIRYEHLGGYQLEERYSKIYQGLQLKQELLEKPFAMLSGGEKTLICLAKVLLMNPELLILDEPTNHLDMKMLAWLEEYLKNYKGSVLFVSHDRYFLSHVATKVVDLEQGRSVVYPYSYDQYVSEKQKLREEQEEKYKEQQKQIRKMEEAIKRLRIWAAQADNKKMFAQAKSMQKRLDKVDRVERPSNVNYQANLEFQMMERSGKDVLRVEQLSKAFGTKQLLKEANLNIYYQEHIAMIGPNGCGKSTFLHMLLGTESVDAGEIRVGESLKIAYLPQNVTFSHEDWTVLETFREDLNLSEGDARELLARHLFTKDTVFKKVQNLSGGERSRLKFAMLIQHDINFLILDEPTNHLDIPSRERLEEALLAFKGTVLMITHDRFFMNRIATRIVEFEEGDLVSYFGGYDDYIAEKKKLADKPNKETSFQKAKKTDGMLKPESEKTQPKKSQYSLKIRLSQLELEIEELEGKRKELESEVEKSSTDFMVLNQLQQELKEVESGLEVRMSEWMEVSSDIEG